jgi:hypothetical protein
MLKAVVSDNGFPSLDLQRRVIEAAGFEIREAQPKCITEDDFDQPRCFGFATCGRSSSGQSGRVGARFS